MKTFFKFLLFISIISCQSTQKEFLLESFTDFPPEIDGCACYFSANQADFDNGIYLYLDDYADKAFVTIKDNLITFNRQLNDESEEEISEWVHKDLKMSLETQEQGTIDETTQYVGSLKLTKAGKTILIQEGLVGECGC